MKAIAKTLALAAIAGASLFGSQRADAQVNVDVDVTVGSITILYYYNDIDVDITSAVLTSLIGNTAGCVAGGLEVDCLIASPTPPTTHTAGQLNWDGAMAPGVGPSLSAIPLNLQNVWAVRALGGTATTTVTIGGTGGIAAGTGTGAGTIGVTSRNIDDDADGCTGGAATATFPDPGLGNALPGSVCLILNLSTITGAGTFLGTGDASDTIYTLDVTAT